MVQRAGLACPASSGDHFEDHDDNQEDEGYPFQSQFQMLSLQSATEHVDATSVREPTPILCMMVCSLAMINNEMCVPDVQVMQH